MLDSAKETIGDHFPSLIGSGLIGAGVSLVTGAVGGPLLGAAIGAGTDLAIKSEGVKNWLFGEYDDDGRRKGNIISKDLANNIEKYLPGMAKGAIAGGITSILPFVPGGPVSGIILGSAIGFAKNNEKIKNTLFGYMDEEHNEWHDGILPKNFIEKLQGVVPDAVLGMLGGAAGTAILGGPFGLVGNMALGGAIGILVSTETFQDKLFGKKDPATGIRQGGLLGAVKEGFVDPLIDTGKSIKDKLVDWFKRDIAHPLASAIRPLAKQGGLLLGGIATGISRIVGDKFANEIGGGFSGLGHFLREKVGQLTKVGLGIAQATARPVGKMISAPTRFIGNLGERFRKRHVADGDATYMTAKQRLQYRQELEDNVVYKKYDSDEYDEDGYLIHRKGDVMVDDLGQPIKDGDRGFKYFHNTLGRGKMKKRGKHADKFAQFDEMLVGMNKDELGELRDAVNYLKDPNQEAQRQRKKSVDTINDVVHNKYGLSYKESKHLLSLFRDGKIDKASDYIGKLGLTEDDEVALRNTLTQQYSIYQASDETLTKSKGFRSQLYKELKDMGLNINDKNLDKHLRLIDQEYNEKDKMDPIQKLDESQKERHQEIVDLFNKAIDTIKAMNDEEFREELIKRDAAKNKRAMEVKTGLLGNTFNKISRNHIANSGALWGRNYEMEYVEDPETGEQQWYMVNKKTLERTQVDAAGNPVDGSARPIDVQLNTVGRRARKAIGRNVANAFRKSGAWNKLDRVHPIKDRRDKKHESAKEEAIMGMIIDYVNQNSDNINVPDDTRYTYIKDKNGRYKKVERINWVLNWLGVDNYTDAAEALKEKYNVDILSDNKKYGSEDDRRSYFRHKISQETGISARKLKRRFATHKRKHGKNKGKDRGGFAYKDDNGNMHSLDEEDWYNDHSGNYSGEKGKRIVGEEADVLNKRRTVFDLFANPITVVRGKDGRWVQDQNDSDNKRASLARDTLLTMGDKITNKIGGLAKDVKDGFLHFFNIDAERDGWLKTMLKVGTGVLGVLTAAGVAARSQTWWEERIKPALVGWYKAHVYPTLERWLEPIRPGIAKLAIGIDSTIQRIPNAIHSLGDRIKGFITDDLPSIWATKILPFYQDGYNWLINNVSTIVEKVVYNTVKVAPAIITGAIKGATKFLSNDILTIITGLGRRDANGIKTSLTNSPAINGALAGIDTLSSAADGLRSFNGASKIASALGVRQSDFDRASGSYGTVSESSLAGFYANDDLTQEHPSSSDASTFDGYAAMDTPTTSQSKKGTSTSTANFGNNANNNNAPSLDVSTMVNYSAGLASSSGSTSIDPASEKAIDDAYRENKKSTSSYNNSTKNTTNASNASNNKASNSISNTAYKVGATAAAALRNVQNSITANNNNEGLRTSKATVVSDNGVYNTTDSLRAGSSAGISLYNASYDQATGLVYSQNGEFIPNAYYDPATGNITDSPTHSALQQWPNITHSHDFALEEALNTGALDPAAYYGSDMPDTGGEPDWMGITLNNLKDTVVNVGNMIGNKNSIGGRLTGLSTLRDGETPTGLLRTAITGQTGVVGRIVNHTAESWSKKGLVRRSLAKPLGKLDKAFTYASDNSVLSRLNGKWNRSINNATSIVQNAVENTDLNDLKSAYDFRKERIARMQDVLKQNPNNQTAKAELEKVIKQNDGIIKEATEKLNKGIINGATEHLDDAAKEAIKAANANNVDDILKAANNAAHGNGSLFSNIKSNLDNFFESFTKHNEAKSLLSTLSKTGGISESAVREQFENISDALAKEASNVAERAGKSVAGKLARLTPLVNFAFYAVDFATGCANANNYLGISDNAMANMDLGIPSWFLRIIIGLAHVISQNFLLGIIPTSSICDVFTTYLLPLFGVDMTEYNKAIELSQQELEKYREETGDEFAKLEDLNNYTSMSQTFLRTIGLVEDAKKNSRYASRRGGTDLLNNLMSSGGEYKSAYNGKPSQSNAINPKTLTQSDINALKANINSVSSGKGSGLLSGRASTAIYGLTSPSSHNITSTATFDANMYKDDLVAYQKYNGNNSLTMGDLFNYYATLTNAYYNGTIKDRNNIYNQESNSDMTNYVRQTVLKNPSADMSDVFNYYKSQCDKYASYMNTHTTNEVIHFNEYTGSGSGIGGFGYYGSGNRFYRPYSSIGSITDMIPKEVSQPVSRVNKYIGSGSGIAGTSNPSSYIVNFVGSGTKNKTKLKQISEDSINLSRTTNIVSESARIAMYMQSRGNIANMTLEKDKTYSIGCVGWNNGDAIIFLKGLLKTKPSAFKKVLGNKLYSLINSSKKFKKDTFTQTQLEKIRAILSTEESRKVQIKVVKRECKKYIDDIKKVYNNAQTVLFLSVLAFKKGIDSNIICSVKKTDLDFSSFYTKFTTKNTDLYGNNKDYLDQLYQLVTNSGVMSTDTTGTVKDSDISSGMGVTDNGSSGSSSSSSESGSWFERLKTAITNMGNALFGIDSYGKEGSSNDNSETTNYGGENDPLKEQEKIVDNCQEFCDRFNNPAYTLKERINYLRQAFETDVDLTVENFSKGTGDDLDLIHYLYNSKKFQKLLEKYQQAPTSNSSKLIAAVGNAWDKISNIGQTNEVSSDDSNTGEDLYAEYKASNVTYGVGKNKKKVKYANTSQTMSAEVGPQLIKAILKDKDFANGIYTEFSNIANNVKAASSVEDAQLAAKFYLNSYIANDKKAKETPFYNMLMYGENSKKIIKEYYGDRMSFIIKFSEYIADGTNGIGPDWESLAFASKKDRAIANLGAAMSVLNESHSDLDSKEWAWDTGVNAIADLLGIENTLDSTSIKSSAAKKNDKIITTFSKNSKRNKKAFNNGFNIFSESIMNSKKTKNKELIKDTFALFPNVTDFSSLFKEGNKTDIITPFAATKGKELLSANKIRQFNLPMNKKFVKIPDMTYIDNDKYKYLKEFSGKELKAVSEKRNVFNPYTLQKIMLETKYSDDSELYTSSKSNKKITFSSMYDYLMDTGQTGIKNNDVPFKSTFSNLDEDVAKDISDSAFRKINNKIDPETAKAFVLYYNNRRTKELKDDPTRYAEEVNYEDSNEYLLQKFGNSLLPRYINKIKLNKSYLPFRDYIYTSALKASFDAISHKRRLMLDNFRNTYSTGWFSGWDNFLINGQNLIKYQDMRENTKYKTMYNVNDMKTDVDKQILRTMIDQVGENGEPMIVPDDTEESIYRKLTDLGALAIEQIGAFNNPLLRAGSLLSDLRDTELNYNDETYSDQYDIFNQESEFNKQLHDILAMAESANKRRASFKLYYPTEGNELYKFVDIVNKASSSHDQFTDYSNVDDYFSKTGIPGGDKIGSEYASEHTEVISNDIPVLINAYTKMNMTPKTPFIMPDGAVPDLAKYIEGDNSASGNWYPHYNLVSNTPNLDIEASSVGKQPPTNYSVDNRSDPFSGGKLINRGREQATPFKDISDLPTPKELSKNVSIGTKPPLPKSGKGSSLRDMITAKGNNFISQLDYKNMKFSDGESMADAGCGPAVAAMAINGLSGGASMMETAALADKYKTNGGTSADYFQDVFSRAGAKTTYYEGSKASSGAVKSLKAGQQVVLLGQDRNNKSKANSPFGPGNHYVLAKGMSNGKVAINDPEQHGTKIYNKNILKNTKLSMAVSGKGSGLTKFHGTKLNNYIGAGKSKTGGTVYKIPGGCGVEMNYQAQDSLAYKAGKIIAASTVDEYGFRKVNGRYCVSLTPFLSSNGKYTYKGVNGTKKYNNQDDNMNGRYFDAYLSGGIRIPCIVCDIKGKDNKGTNADYGHHNGKNVLEFVKCESKKWPDNPGTSTFVKKYPKFKKWNSGGYGPKRTVKVVISDYTWFQDPNIGKDVIFAKDKVGTVIDGSVGSDGSSKSGKNGSTGTWMDRIINNINIMGKALLGMDEDGNGGNDTASGYVGTGLASDVVKVAKAELGYKPSANNQSKYSKEFGVSNAQWCAYFVSWVFKKACGGVKKMKKVLGTGPVGSVTALLSTFKSKGMLKKNPHVGDVVIWKEGRSHTGIVISVNTKKKTFTTVEGNTGNDEVGKRTYSFSNATGFGRPNYESGSGSGITADSAYNRLLMMSGKGSNISKSGLNIDLTKSEKEIFDQIVSASDKAAKSSASGKGSRMSNSVIRNTNNIQATDLVLRNAARGSSIGSRSNARAISRISNSGNFVYSGAGSNLIKSGINRSYGRGTSDSPTMNDIYETSNRINSSYDSDHSTYIDPDTGEELMLDEVYSGGASKKKAKKRNKAASKHAVNTVKQGFKTGGTISTAAETSVVSDENTRNYILLRSMLTLLKSIEKSERKNADIVTILKKMYSKMGGSTSALNAILKNSKSKSSNSDKKKAKGSELYSGKAAQMANRMNNSSSSDMARLASITQSHSEDEYSEMNELIKELTRITMD